jgi:hypothetical protein
LNVGADPMSRPEELTALAYTTQTYAWT